MNEIEFGIAIEIRGPLLGYQTTSEAAAQSVVADDTIVRLGAHGEGRLTSSNRGEVARDSSAPRPGIPEGTTVSRELFDAWIRPGPPV